jgi:hypothetical protein
LVDSNVYSDCAKSLSVLPGLVAVVLSLRADHHCNQYDWAKGFAHYRFDHWELIYRFDHWELNLLCCCASGKQPDEDKSQIEIWSWRRGAALKDQNKRSVR